MKANHAEEYGAYRFHRKLRLMCRIAFFYNMAYGNYGFAFVYAFAWVWETVASGKHYIAWKRR